MTFARMHNDYLDPDRHLEQEGPCPYCGKDAAICECAPCETCGEIGMWDCHIEHNHMPDLICGESDIFSFFSVEGNGPNDCRKRVADTIYENTSCGAWLEFNEGGITVGSIVEGCDFGTATYPLHYPFKSADLQARIDAVEKEAGALWDWANVLRDKNGRKHMNGKTWAERGLDAPDVDRDYAHFEQGERSS